jgi:hypothetical protein
MEHEMSADKLAQDLRDIADRHYLELDVSEQSSLMRAAEALAAHQAQQAEPEQKPCLVSGACKHGGWCTETYCQEHCQFVKEDPQQEPVAWVDERAIGWLEGRGKTASITTRLQAHKSPERPMPLYAVPQQAQAPGWQPIETAPKDGRDMFVVRAFCIDPTGRASSGGYTSDAYCVWRGDEGRLMRWPHVWQPTHWMPLPPSPQQGDKTT